MCVYMKISTKLHVWYESTFQILVTVFIYEETQFVIIFNHETDIIKQLQVTFSSSRAVSITLQWICCLLCFHHLLMQSIKDAPKEFLSIFLFTLKTITTTTVSILREQCLYKGPIKITLTQIRAVKYWLQLSHHIVYSFSTRPSYQ